MKRLDNLNGTIESAIRGMIRNISIISLAVLVLIGIIIALGATFDFGLHERGAQAILVFTFLASGFIVATWFGNGKRAAMSSKSYEDILDTYFDTSTDVDIDTLRLYLMHEKDERQKQFEIIAMRASGLTFQELYELGWKELKKRKPSFSAKKFVKKCRKKKYPRLAFTTAERLLNLGTKDSNRGDETRQNADTVYAGVALSARIVSTLPYLFLGVGIALNFSLGSVWQAILSTLIMCFAFATALASGYSIGHKTISVYRQGVYTTAVKYLNSCEKYAEKNDKPYRTEIKIDHIKEQLKKIVDERIAEEWEADAPEADETETGSE